MAARWAWADDGWLAFGGSWGRSRARRRLIHRMPERLRREIEAAMAGAAGCPEQAARADRLLDAVPPVCLWRP